MAEGSQVDAQLVVIGPHGGKGFRARILGTTADRVLHDADVPCLVIRGLETSIIIGIGIIDAIQLMEVAQGLKVMESSKAMNSKDSAITNRCLGAGLLFQAARAAAR